MLAVAHLTQQLVSGGSAARGHAPCVKDLPDLGIAIRITIVFIVVMGLVYPLVMTGIAQTLFRDKANGSLVTDKNGTVVGSSLIGQNFTADKYFHGRLGHDRARIPGTRQRNDPVPCRRRGPGRLQLRADLQGADRSGHR